MRHITFLVVALVGSLGGCKAEIPEARLACTVDGDCPPRWFCHADQLCYRGPDGLGDGGVDGGRDAAVTPCDGTGECDDGEACNGAESCVEGRCAPGTPIECRDDDPCTTDVCRAGACEHPREPNGASCGAGMMRCCGGACVDAATSSATCGLSCTDCGTNSICSEGLCGCVADYDDCDGVAGCEAHLPSDDLHCGSCPRSCGAGTSCIGGECRTCSGAGDCDDRLDCTADSCAGTCEHMLLDSFCLIAGACYAGGTRHPTNECLECAPASSRSEWSERSGRCNDGTVAGCGTCSATGCMTAPTCNDGNPCTADRCDDATGACSAPAAPPGSPCDDGIFCNGNDICAGGTCSIHMVDPCGGLICDEATDSCLPCGDFRQPCCPGGGCLTPGGACCACYSGTCLDCATHADCGFTPYCPGTGDRWECEAGRCVYGPCG